MQICACSCCGYINTDSCYVKAEYLSLERRDNIYLSFAVLQIIVLLIPAIFYSKLRRGNDISNLRLRGINPDKLYFTILTAFLLLFVSAAFKLLYIRLGIYDSRFAEYASYINIASFTSVSDIVYMIITFVLIPAVSEEFIFVQSYSGNIFPTNSDI